MFKVCIFVRLVLPGEMCIGFQKHGLKLNFISLKTRFRRTNAAILGGLVGCLQTQAPFCDMAGWLQSPEINFPVSSSPLKCLMYVCVKPLQIDVEFDRFKR